MNTDLIQQSIKSLLESKEKAQNWYSEWEKAFNSLRNLPQNKVLDDAMEYIRYEKVEANTEVIDVSRAIESIQKICPHEFQYDGHGHNYSVYICTYCGSEEEH